MIVLVSPKGCCSKTGVPRAILQALYGRGQVTEALSALADRCVGECEPAAD
jgi:hypothetical protein